MRHLVRAGGALVGIGALLVLMAGTTLAGNFAEVTYIDGRSGEPPVAGEEREFRFVLMQHGVTPVDDGRVDLTLSNAGTGEIVTVAATPLGDGAWTATVTFPSGGDWHVGVTHEWFETSVPIVMAVTPAEQAAAASTAAILAVAAFGAVAIAIAGGMLLLVRGRRAPAVATAEEPAGAPG